MLKLLEDFRDVCERGSVLIISGSTEYEFSAAIFNKLSKVSKFTINMGCLRTKTDERMVKDWWRMVFTPNRREKLFTKKSIAPRYFSSLFLIFF